MHVVISNIFRYCRQ